MKTLPERDVVIVGFGWTGAIVAEQLTLEGLDVLALERGVWADTSTDYAVNNAQDEVRYRYRDELFEDLSRETLTFRNTTDQSALPMRMLGSFLPGTNVGGSITHWNGQAWRFLPSDFQARSHNLERYGEGIFGENMTVQDWGVTYDELEPHYDTFDKICGISGKAGNLNGEIQEGGNPFEGARSSEYPNPPMEMVAAPLKFAAAARELGYKPFPGPSANMSQAYTNPLGVQLAPCSYCGFCEKYACGNYSKATALTTIVPALMRRDNFTLRTGAMVLRVEKDAQNTRATGVTYIDSEGQEYFQPAQMVVLCTYITHNVNLLLQSQIGEPYDPSTGRGNVGRNYAYQAMSGADVFYDDFAVNPYIGAGALGQVIDEFNGDNFDHTGLGFIGGGYIAQWQTNGRPIEHHPVPEGTPKFGAGWKKAVRENYNHTIGVGAHGAVMSHRGNYLDLDPTYKDAYGRPLMRLTFDYKPNEIAMSAHLTEKVAGIARAMGGREVKVSEMKVPYDIAPYQTTHNTGGHIMGETPTDSVTNKYNQSWDLPNLFLMGAGNFPQNPGYNPTGTVAALAYHSMQAVRERYLRDPGPLVQA
ncbi:gluconate 2-dehydrogenase alpha chain [Palleronia aestuarii]|uniref:Gluconate 2-dehydrogenase alpha chain n=1 Tax=Palleronia aestuarii TaxID=568105 RepID=A0A2W7N5E8_9RHOB|nr:GMC family oxidoreductase [Palleronia aestuarii]PZX15268.1 gluconate 2-dehydrogenase alpha chain [Palleronia aestuarii]